MDVSKLMVIWPNNIDSTKTIKKGRRIPKTSACKPPHALLLPARRRRRGCICNPLPFFNFAFVICRFPGGVGWRGTDRLVSADRADWPIAPRWLANSPTLATPCSAAKGVHHVVVDFRPVAHLSPCPVSLPIRVYMAIALRNFIFSFQFFYLGAFLAPRPDERRSAKR